ncbi:MAG: amino acid adenylation domain-containing protein, partial [Candidatus Binatia bacterium]
MRLSAEGERLRINAPKGTLNPVLREQIAKLKDEVLVHLRDPDGPRVHTKIPRIADDQPAPLSFAQERLWFLEQLEPESAVFNLCRAIRITGQLDLPVLEASLSELQHRHESLRTKFVMIDGGPRQIVLAAEKVTHTPVDLRTLSKARKETEAARLMFEEMRQLFDLTQGKMFRTRLLRLDDDRHILALITHHLVADAWSMGILMRELWALYEDYRLGKWSQLLEVPCRYRDYAVWQRETVNEAFEADLAYWKEKLDAVPVLDLPIDRPRPPAPSFRGASVTIEIPTSVTEGLNEVSRREGATLFMSLLAALQILLCRWTGQEDIAVGAPVANRERPELEGIIGLFVNTLVLRADLSGAPSFRELLGRVREVCLDAYAHQSVAFEFLVRQLSPQRALQGHPLFQVMMVLQNTPSRSTVPAGLTLEPFEIDGESAQFDLSLYLRERGGRLIGYLEYSTALFERATIERMAGHFEILLRGIVADPDRSIATLPLLSVQEQKQSLIEWNDTAAFYPKEWCIHELFEAQTARTPDAVALECEEKKIGYGELNSRANRLAYELQKLGVGPERLVGVLAERSLETIIVILAILKAGGAYVPLDPYYPRERSRFMLADAGAGVLLTQRKFAGYFPGYSGATVLIDELLRGAAGAAVNLPRSADSESAAYVIYTSGSTGIPKGVVALHRGALNRFAWMWKTYPFGTGEKSCQKTSLSFVDSVWEIFGALLQGVPAVLIPDAVAKEPRPLVDHLAERDVTRLVVVPSFLKEILNRCGDLPQRLACLKYCFSSGETLSRDLAEKFRQVLPACRLINLYGSSEVAGDVTCYEVGDVERGSTIPIGRPIANTQIYLLDPYLQPVPIGARGELYVGGDNLARGYLHRPELTAERFIANPFDSLTGSRLYRSGDLARYRADGNIEFLGRSDGQIKIRGARVELGEIEAALAAHPAIQKSVVVAPGSPADSNLPPSDNSKSKIVNPKLLTAYVVARKDRPTTAELKSFLKARLPDYMMPSEFVFLEGMTLLPSGKVDRRALPRNLPGRDNFDAAVAEPRTEVEILIAGVWCQVLKRDRVGIDDNFFELGGHSLMAAEVAAKLRDAFDRPVTVRDLFDSPTVAGLARAIERTVQGEVEGNLPPIRPVARKRHLPLSLGQEPLFLFSQLFGGGDFLNMPYAYRLDGTLDLIALRQAIQEIVRRHAALRTGFLDSAVGPRQFVRRSATIKLPLVDLIRLPEQQKETKLEQISKQDAAHSFDLEKPPLLRIKLLRLAEARHVLLVTTHHMISDQWSMGVFRRELAALYDAFSQGLPSPLPELSVQFADFAHWQRRLLKNGLFQRQISYWLKQLGTPSAPLDFCRGKNKKSVRFHSSRRPVEINDRLFASVKAFAREQDCTPFMVFVAALNILLHRHTGASDIRIGTLVANRGQPGTEKLIGNFVNALVLRTRIQPRMSFADVISQVRTTSVAAFAHQDLPFEHLEALLEHKHGKHAPLYQVMLNYRNQTTPTLEANGLAIASWNGKQRAEDPGIAI